MDEKMYSGKNLALEMSDNPFVFTVRPLRVNKIFHEYLCPSVCYFLVSLSLKIYIKIKEILLYLKTLISVSSRRYSYLPSL